jgi:hypothetical protein
MRLRYQSSSEYRIDQLAQLCLDSKLFRRGWNLETKLRRIQRCEETQKESHLIVATCGGVPVGVVCVTGQLKLYVRTNPAVKRRQCIAEGTQVAFYVRRTWRRNGIGSRLARRLRKERGTIKDLIGLRGESRSHHFFHSSGIRWDFVDNT